ncbi:hypothetical protein BGLA2_60112 [Burkholderia gladioli]|nr:hypothetical protein BGLA2_60112 [Burkholderia gladioli]
MSFILVILVILRAKIPSISGITRAEAALYSVAGHGMGRRMLTVEGTIADRNQGVKKCLMKNN